MYPKSVFADSHTKIYHMTMDYILAIDQGTTSSRAILFDDDFNPASMSQEEFPQYFPKPGWVEHSPEEIWSTVLKTTRNALSKLDSPRVMALGITNQRETTLVWEKSTGNPVYPAIVWQDRRTADTCAKLRATGVAEEVVSRTGLLLDPYFSATKLGWILENVDGALTLARDGKLLFGTVDTYLVWRLTNGKRHLTDATNASRTMLYNISLGKWDSYLLDLFGIPANMLPEVIDSSDDFGETNPELFGTSIPIRGIAGDQQAATIGQACIKPGMVKATYGTGCFALINTGQERISSSNKLLTTIAYKLNGKPTYALEGSIFSAGSTVQWLRDGLKLIENASDTQKLAMASDPEQVVYLVPAFTGLGAPYWDPDCRGAIYGITRNTGPEELARAALESVAYQTNDLLSAMQMDIPNLNISVLRVDGGMTASDWTMQSIANLVGSSVDRPVITETTALGAAYLAGLYLGVFETIDEIENNWKLETRFNTSIDDGIRVKRIDGWRNAVARTLSTRN